MIYESFKKKDKIIAGLENPLNKDKFEIYDSEDKQKLLKFY